MDTNDREIMNASATIDQALDKMDEANRGEQARYILNVVRNLNDHIALKVWRDIEPRQPMDINKVAKKLISRAPYQFIGRFDKYLRKSVSHFTPNEDGAERLSLKYYPYLRNLKKLMKDKYDIDIINNINKFLPNLDKQTQSYYDRVAEALKNTSISESEEDKYDNYYINRVVPFVSNNRMFYEVTLEPAEEKPNKFNRIIAFCKGEIMQNYCVALSFAEKEINIFDTVFPIKIITGWRVSIRPCEINNFSKIFGITTNIKREHNEYYSLMSYMTKNSITLLDIIDFDEEDYSNIKSLVANSTRNKSSVIFKILDICRGISIGNRAGKNIIRYLLCRMNNRIIKMQSPYGDEGCFCYRLPYGCLPFDEKPLAFNPRGHRANLSDVLESINEIDVASLLARVVNINTNQNYQLFTPLSELQAFGSEDEIIKLVTNFNESLYYKFRPESEMSIYNGYLFKRGDEQNLVRIINELSELSKEPSIINECFSIDNIENLEHLPDVETRLTDPAKKEILIDMFKNSRVRFVYGAAGTGKTTLINYVAKSMEGKKKLFLSKTNPALENLKHRITYRDEWDECVTIDSFIKNKKYIFSTYDLIVVDECSTVTNEEILEIIERLYNGVLLLVGDVYQIQAIGFGNWFNIVKEAMPNCCCSELITPFRSTDVELKAFWKEVRELADDHTVLEELVRSEYSHIIDKSIFEKKSEDEIILCLNYNGLYGLNNINKLMQLDNKNKAVSINVWQFKVGDPILFNDSERFEILYNNLKGKIVDIEEDGNDVKFVIEVNAIFSHEEINRCSGLTFVGIANNKTIVSFIVKRRPPYSSDSEAESNEHILPFEVAYAVSIHKSQGLEYESVKIVIADDSEERITHSIFYTAITRAKTFLKIFWSPEVGDRVIKRLCLPNYNRDYLLLKNKNNL